MYAQRKDVALVAPKILFENNTIAYAGIALDKKKKDKIRFLCQGVSDEEQGYEAIFKICTQYNGSMADVFHD